jgi:hypothetical protein
MVPYPPDPVNHYNGSQEPAVHLPEMPDLWRLAAPLAHSRGARHDLVTVVWYSSGAGGLPLAPSGYGTGRIRRSRR